jgi:hypothetical protein
MPRGGAWTVSKKPAAAIIQFECVYRSADDTVAKTTGDTVAGYGFAQEAASAANTPARITIVVGGYAIAKAAITEGAALTCVAAGKVQTWASGDRLVGYATQDADADGDIIGIICSPGPVITD